MLKIHKLSMMSMSTPFQGIQSAVKKSIDQDFLNHL